MEVLNASERQTPDLVRTPSCSSSAGFNEPPAGFDDRVVLYLRNSRLTSVAEYNVMLREVVNHWQDALTRPTTSANLPATSPPHSPQKNGRSVPIAESPSPVGREFSRQPSAEAGDNFISFLTMLLFEVARTENRFKQKENLDKVFSWYTRNRESKRTNLTVTGAPVHWVDTSSILYPPRNIARPASTEPSRPHLIGIVGVGRKPADAYGMANRAKSETQKKPATTGSKRFEARKRLEMEEKLQKQLEERRAKLVQQKHTAFRGMFADTGSVDFIKWGEAALQVTVPNIRPPIPGRVHWSSAAFGPSEGIRRRSIAAQKGETMRAKGQIQQTPNATEGLHAQPQLPQLHSPLPARAPLRRSTQLPALEYDRWILSSDYVMKQVGGELLADVLPQHKKVKPSIRRTYTPGRLLSRADTIDSYGRGFSPEISTNDYAAEDENGGDEDEEADADPDADANADEDADAAADDSASDEDTGADGNATADRDADPDAEGDAYGTFEDWNDAYGEDGAADVSGVGGDASESRDEGRDDVRSIKSPTLPYGAASPRMLSVNSVVAGDKSPEKKDKGSTAASTHGSLVHGSGLVGCELVGGCPPGYQAGKKSDAKPRYTAAYVHQFPDPSKSAASPSHASDDDVRSEPGDDDTDVPANDASDDGNDEVADNDDQTTLDVDGTDADAHMGTHSDATAKESKKSRSPSPLQPTPKTPPAHPNAHEKPVQNTAKSTVPAGVITVPVASPVTASGKESSADTVPNTGNAVPQLTLNVANAGSLLNAANAGLSPNAGHMVALDQNKASDQGRRPSLQIGRGEGRRLSVADDIAPPEEMMRLAGRRLSLSQDYKTEKERIDDVQKAGGTPGDIEALKQEAAALLIQRTFRGHLVRKIESKILPKEETVTWARQYKHELDRRQKEREEKAAVVLQSSYRGFKLRKSELEKILASKRIHDIFSHPGVPRRIKSLVAATAIQSLFRGFRTRMLRRKLERQCVNMGCGVQEIFFDYRTFVDIITTSLGLPKKQYAVEYEHVIAWLKERDELRAVFERMCDPTTMRILKSVIPELCKELGHFPSAAEIRIACARFNIQGETLSEFDTERIVFSIYPPPSVEQPKRVSTWTNPIVKSTEAMSVADKLKESVMLKKAMELVLNAKQTPIADSKSAEKPSTPSKGDKANPLDKSAIAKRKMADGPSASGSARRSGTSIPPPSPQKGKGSAKKK